MLRAYGGDPRAYGDAIIWWGDSLGPTMVGVQSPTMVGVGVRGPKAYDGAGWGLLTRGVELVMILVGVME